MTSNEKIASVISRCPQLTYVDAIYLAVMLEASGRVVTYGRMADEHDMERGYPPSREAIITAVNRMRKRICGCNLPLKIHTARGVGYWVEVTDGLWKCPVNGRNRNGD